LYGDTVRQNVNQSALQKLAQNIVVAWARLDMEIGNTSRVVTLLQALIEFHFAAPPELNHKKFESKFAKLESFFNGGYPRFGDQNSEGKYLK
jgi:hypothetical protein